MRGDRLIQIPIGQTCGDLSERLFLEWARIFVQIDKNKSGPFADGNLVERELGGIETTTLETPGRCNQLAFQRVGP